MSTTRLRRLGETGDTATRSRAGRPPNGLHANILTDTCKLMFFGLVVPGEPVRRSGYSGDMVGWLCASASTLPFRLIHPLVNCGPSTLARWFLHQHQPGLNLVTSIPAQRCPFLSSTPFFPPTGDANSRFVLILPSPLVRSTTDALPKAKPPLLFKSLHRETQTASPFGPPPSDQHHPSTRTTLTPQHPPVPPSSWLPPTTTGVACRPKSPHRAPRSPTMMRHAVS